MSVYLSNYSKTGNADPGQEPKENLWRVSEIFGRFGTGMPVLPEIGFSVPKWYVRFLIIFQLLFKSTKNFREANKNVKNNKMTWIIFLEKNFQKFSLPI